MCRFFSRWKYLAFLLLFCFGCENIEIPEIPKSNEKEKRTEDEDVPDTTILNSLRVGSRTHPYLPSDFASGGVMDGCVDNPMLECSDVWVCGYVVGYVSGSKITSTKFEAGDKETNVVLADFVSQTDVEKLMPVQLSKTPQACNEVRERLNLMDNPDNLQRLVKVQGSVERYMGTLGVKSTNKCIFVK